MDSATRLSDSFQLALERLTENRTAAAAGAVAGGVVLVSSVYFLYRSRARKSAARAKPRATDIAGGTIERTAVRKAFADYRCTPFPLSWTEMTGAVQCLVWTGGRGWNRQKERNAQSSRYVLQLGDGFL